MTGASSAVGAAPTALRPGAYRRSNAQLSANCLNSVEFRFVYDRAPSKREHNPIRREWRRFDAAGGESYQLENINDIFARMADGRIDGRVVVNLQ